MDIVIYGKAKVDSDSSSKSMLINVMKNIK